MEWISEAKYNAPSHKVGDPARQGWISRQMHYPRSSCPAVDSLAAFFIQKDQADCGQTRVVVFVGGLFTDCKLVPPVVQPATRNTRWNKSWMRCHLTVKIKVFSSTSLRARVDACLSNQTFQLVPWGRWEKDAKPVELASLGRVGSIWTCCWEWQGWNSRHRQSRGVSRRALCNRNRGASGEGAWR